MMNTILYRTSKNIFEKSNSIVWYGILSYGMVWKVWYGMRFQCYAMRFLCYAIVYVVKDKHSVTVEYICKNEKIKPI